MTTTCAREGCTRIIRKGPYLTCSILCRAVVEMLAEAESVSGATQDGHHWSLAVAINDALNEYRESQTRVYRAARDVGITDEEWRAIRRGASRSELAAPAGS